MMKPLSLKEPPFGCPLGDQWPVARMLPTDTDGGWRFGVCRSHVQGKRADLNADFAAQSHGQATDLPPNPPTCQNLCYHRPSFVELQVADLFRAIYLRKLILWRLKPVSLFNPIQAGDRLPAVQLPLGDSFVGELGPEPRPLVAQHRGPGDSDGGQAGDI